MKSIVTSTLLILIIALNSNLNAQETINITDASGLKQGKWIKNFENGNILYEGTFKDNKPVGEFKRYYNTGKLISTLIYSYTSDTVTTIFYYSNGLVAAEGMYTGKSKTGIWKFYSEKKSGTMICIENYSSNLKQDEGIKYHLNGNKAEIQNYKDNIKEGRWCQYYTDEVLCVKSQYKNGKLIGKFETFFPDGKKEIIGYYNNDTRNGEWLFYNKDGSFKRKIVYRDGIADNNAELIKEETDYLDKLEKEGGKIKDPAKGGTIWQ